MTSEKINRVSEIVTNFIVEMGKESVTNYEFAEAIATVIVSLCEGNMAHEDVFLELINHMVKSMSLLNPNFYKKENVPQVSKDTFEEE